MCIHLLANGEFDDGTDAAEVAGVGMARMWGDLELIPGGDELGFSWADCDGCGDPLAGDRYLAYVLIPVAGDAR